MIALSEQGRVAVTDMLGQAASRAATALGRRIGIEVALSVPTVDVLYVRVASDLLAVYAPEDLLAVRQRFDGGVRGAAAIVVPSAERAMLGTLARADRDGAVDVGRAVLTACLGAFAAAFGDRIEAAAAEVVAGTPAGLLETLADVHSAEAMLLFLNVEFAVAGAGGAIVLVMAVESTDRFGAQLEALIARPQTKRILTIS